MTKNEPLYCLTPISPSFWWVCGSTIDRSATEKIKLGTSFEVKSGKQFLLTVSGVCTLFRPAVVSTEFEGKPWTSVIAPHPDIGVVGGNYLWMGSHPASREGSMNWQTKMVKDFEGEASFLQLANVTFFSSSRPLPEVSTKGSFMLDAEIMPFTLVALGDSPIAFGFIPLYDAPGVALNWGASDFASIDFRAKTYLRYKPSGASSIWVTLARYDWTYVSHATKLPSGQYSVTHFPTEDPEFFHDQSFPYWEASVPNR